MLESLIWIVLISTIVFNIVLLATLINYQTAMESLFQELYKLDKDFKNTIKTFQSQRYELATRKEWRSEFHKLLLALDYEEVEPNYETTYRKKV